MKFGLNRDETRDEATAAERYDAFLERLEARSASSGYQTDVARSKPGKARGSRKHGHSGNKRMARRTVIGIVLLAVLLYVAVPAGAIALIMHAIDSTMQDTSQEVRQHLDPVPETTADGQATQAFYALLLGTDKGEHARTDAMILARIDPGNAKSIDLISIPRDTMVTLNGGIAKINAAYVTQGVTGALDAVSAFAGVPISHYAQIDFSQLEALVDMLGGVRVNVPQDISGGNGGVTLHAGEQVLNGQQALGFVRERYVVVGGDFSRAQAQRMVAEALITQALQTSAGQLPELIRKAAQSVKTDYSVTDIIALASDFQGKSVTIRTGATPSYAFQQGGVSYVGTQYDEWRTMMQRVDAGLGPDDNGSAIPEAQQRDETLGAATNGASPRDYAGLVDGSLNTDDVIGEQ